MKLLDACCGSGASAIPAAARVGPQGSVLTVDLAEHLLGLLRAKAGSHDLDNVEFRCGDFLSLDLPDGSFDAVICVFGIFFADDVKAAAQELWRLVRPGGQLAVTTWGPRLFEPVNSVFWDAVRAVQPRLFRAFNPWDHITTPDAVRAGADRVEVIAEDGWHPIGSPDDSWSIAMGSGYRGTIEQLSPQERRRVQQVCAEFLRREQIRALETNVVYGLARKRDTATLA